MKVAEVLLTIGAAFALMACIPALIMCWSLDRGRHSLFDEAEAWIGLLLIPALVFIALAGLVAVVAKATA